MKRKTALRYKKPTFTVKKIKLNLFFFGNEMFSTQFDQGIGSNLLAVSCCGTCFSCSDRQLKQNIHPIGEVLDKFDTIKAVSFDWNKKYQNLKKSMNMHQMGVIAQDVERVFPQFVAEIGETRYKAVDYGGLTTLLIQAVKELHCQNKELTAKVDAMQKLMTVTHSSK